MDWRTIPNAKHRYLVQLYVETDKSTEECARIAGFTGTRLTQVTQVVLRRLRAQGYEIPYRNAALATPDLIGDLRKTMLQCAEKLETRGSEEIHLVAKRLREAATA